MNLIDHFKATMQQHFPEHDLSINECDDQSFLDAETQAMWMMFQVCNAWQTIETAPKDGRKIELYHAIWKCTITASWREDKEYQWLVADLSNRYPDMAFTHWRPLPIPPLTTEGGV